MAEDRRGNVKKIIWGDYLMVKERTYSVDEQLKSIVFTMQ
jgi:hypothetical protein